MSILVALQHTTRYSYDRPVSFGPQVVRLRPAPYCRTRISHYALTVTPARHVLNWQQDPHGNWLARCVFPDKTTDFAIVVDLRAELEATNPFDFFVEPYAETWPFKFPPELNDELATFAATEPATPRLKAFVASVSRAPRNTVNVLVDLNRRLRGMIRYLIREEPGVQTPDKTLAAGTGSCRDVAWLLVQILRQIGLPARFVSGYLIQLASESVPHDQASLNGWAEAYVPGAGWIGLDATSGLLCSEGHIPLAATRHFRAAAPVTGTVGPCQAAFSHDISIARLPAEP